MREMTDFEQQVAKELTPIIAAFDAASGHDHETGDSERGWSGYPCVCRPDEVAQWLAPRVAAAIDHIADLDEPGADPGNRRVIRETALRALSMSDETLRRGV